MVGMEGKEEEVGGEGEEEEEGWRRRTFSRLKSRCKMEQ